MRNKLYIICVWEWGRLGSSGGFRHGMFSSSVRPTVYKDRCTQYKIIHWTKWSMENTTAKFPNFPFPFFPFPFYPDPVAPTHEGIARLSWPGWLVTYRDKCHALEIERGYGHHLSTNRSRRWLTSLIEAIALTSTPSQHLQTVINWWWRSKKDISGWLTEWLT